MQNTIPMNEKKLTDVFTLKMRNFQEYRIDYDAKMVRSPPQEKFSYLIGDALKRYYQFIDAYAAQSAAFNKTSLAELMIARNPLQSALLSFLFVLGIAVCLPKRNAIVMTIELAVFFSFLSFAFYRIMMINTAYSQMLQKEKAAISELKISKMQQNFISHFRESIGFPLALAKDLPIKKEEIQNLQNNLIDSTGEMTLKDLEQVLLALLLPKNTPATKVLSGNHCLVPTAQV